MTRCSLILLLLLTSVCHASDNLLPESASSTIGYASVQQALAALKEDSGISHAEEDGWLVFTDEAHNTLWSFVPSTHAAYPAVVRRRVVEENRSVNIQMSVLCQAPKKPCDQLVRDFQQLNEKLRQDHQRTSSGNG